MTWEKKEENTQGGIKENGIEKCSKKVFQKKDVNRMKRKRFFKSENQPRDEWELEMR